MGCLNRPYPLTHKWKKIILVDAHVVSALVDGDTIHALISSSIGCDLWSYNKAKTVIRKGDTSMHLAHWGNATVESFTDRTDSGISIVFSSLLIINIRTMAAEVELKNKAIFLGNHSSTLLVELNKERTEEDSYCDVTLCVDEQQFCGHRCVIGKFSKMLHKMFRTEMKEKYDTDVNLKGLNAATMQLVMGYIYTARVEITTDNAVTLLCASDYLQIDALKQHCSEFFMQNISPRNFFGVQKAAKMYNEPSLVKSSATFLSLNKESIVQQPEFTDLNKDEVASLLCSEEERPEREELAYNSIVRWVKHDVEQRQDALPELLKNVKLHLLPTIFLESVVSKEPLIRGSDACKDYFTTEVLKRLRLSPAIRHSASKKTMKIVFIGGKTIRLLNVRSLEITQLPDLPHSSGKACAVCYHNKLFVIGSGDTCSEILCLRLDVEGDTWRNVGKTKQNRSGSKALYDKGRIIVSGGTQRNMQNVYVELFDPRPEQVVCTYEGWMTKARCHHSFCKHHGILVCAGPDNSVEFKPDGIGPWSPGISLYDGAQIKAVVSCGELYAFDSQGWVHWLHPVSGKWEKLIIVDTNVVASFTDDENIYAFILSKAGWDLWTYHLKTCEQKRQHVAKPNTLGRHFAGIIYEEND